MKIHQLMSLLLPLGLAALVSAQPALQTRRAELTELPREYRLDGVVEAVNRSTVSAQTRGEVLEILFDVDDVVQKGDLIVLLKGTEQQTLVVQAEADLKAAEAHLQEVRDEYQRIRGVFEKKLVSQSEMDRSSAALKAAQARQESATAQLQQASEAYGHTRVRAPYSGIVTDRHIEIGEIANPGSRLMSGISLDRLRIIVDLPQSLISSVRKGSEIRVQRPGNGYLAVQKVTIFPYANQGSSTFKVRLDLPDGTEGIFPGMFVKTAFTVGRSRQLLIPTAAVVYRSELTGVYVIGPEGRISLRQIKVGRKWNDDMIAVLSGLTEGEQVALDPVRAGSLLKQQLMEKRDE